jgi:hypothetical protein
MWLLLSIKYLYQSVKFRSWNNCILVNGFMVEGDLWNGGVTVYSFSQTFSSMLRKDCEQRGLSVEVFDLADTDPEERLLQEVCCVYLCVVE